MYLTNRIKTNLVFIFVFIENVVSLYDATLLNNSERNIKLKILFPTKGEGESLCQSLLEYNKELAEIVKEFKSKNGKATVAVNYLIDKNGPLFLDIAIDDVILQNKYGWESEKFAEFYKHLFETKVLWRDLRYHLTENGVSLKPEVDHDIESLRFAFKD